MQLKTCHSFAEMRHRRSKAYVKKMKDYVFMSFCLINNLDIMTY